MSYGKAFEEFVEIVQRLRVECPWDRVQTHRSLRPCMMEEAAELLASVRIYEESGSAENMCEELGDILLQVVLHGRIAEEEGIFTLEDVIRGIGDKMVRRHPHVFGVDKAADAGEAFASWEQVKTREKEGKSWIASPLREIPRELPSLVRAQKMFKKVDALYVKQPDAEVCAQQLEVLAAEVGAADEDRLSGRLAEVVLQCANIARACRIPLDQICNDRLEEMIREYEPEDV